MSVENIQDEIGSESPPTASPSEVAVEAPPAGWTAIAEAAARKDERPAQVQTMAEPLATQLKALAGQIAALPVVERLRAGLPHWRQRLGDALKTLRFAEVTALAPVQPHSPPSAASAPLTLLDPAQVQAKVEHIMGLLPPRGDATLPDNLQSLGHLLADTPPTDDFVAADLLHDCFPRGTRNSDSRVLMAIARNLTRNFGRAGRLPITSGKAWTMIDPALFSDELAAQLAAICQYVLNWQATRKDFLILEFAEVELIEYLFENLHPRRHAKLLVSVMEFKALSLRRMGLIRRIPARIRRMVHSTQPGHHHGSDPADVRAYVTDTLALLDYFSRPDSFAAVAVAAKAARAEVEKLATHLTAPPALDALPEAAAPLHPVMRGLGVPPASPKPNLPAATPPEPSPPRQMTPPAPVVRRRFTKAQKTAAVMRVLHGEDLGWVAVEAGIAPDQLAAWRDAFLDGGSAALTQPTAKPRSRKKPAPEPSVDELKGQLQSLIKTVELLSSQMAQIPAALPAPEPKPAPVQTVLPLPAPSQPPKPRPGPPRNTRFARKNKA